MYAMKVDFVGVMKITDPRFRALSLFETESCQTRELPRWQTIIAIYEEI